MIIFKIKKMRAILSAGVIIFTAMLFASCNESDNVNKEGQDKNNQGEEKIYPVRVMKIKKQTVSKTLEYSANLIASKEVHYAPASPGRINNITVEVGNRVTKGQVLVEMDKTQLQQALTQLENARSNYSRIDTLNSLGSISEQQYEQAKTQFELAKTNVDFLMENTTLMSPINGIVTGKYYESGELYSGAPNTAAGKAAIISLMQIDPLKVIVSISQKYFPDIKKGMKAKVTSDIYEGDVFEGAVSKVHPTIDAGTRTFQTEILIENNEEKLRPGMFANIELAIKDAEALIVPAIAILKQEGTNNRYVFLNDNGNAKQVEVTPGKRYDDKIEIITNGVSEGGELIIEGHPNLLNGSKIKVIK